MISFITLIYNLFITILWPVIRFIYPLMDRKFKSSLPDRNESVNRLAAFRRTIEPDRPIVWFHAASMGEFEQARPLISALRKEKTPAAVVVTFMSPSGYEARKSYPEADLVIYLPLDFWISVGAFYKSLSPATGLISRYEFWPNLLIRAKEFNIPLILFNASLKENHGYGKWYLRWFFRPLFMQYAEILTVSELHLDRFSQLVNTRVAISVIGDSRFDQVIARSHEKDPEIEALRRTEKLTLVLGSVWESDLKIWLPVLQNMLFADKNLRVILVPHEIHPENEEQIEGFFQGFNVSTWSKGPNPGFDVLWADVMGKLMKLYALADAAYVGGGFGVHVHNILEPAVYGIPVSHGPVFQKAPEAVEMAEDGITTVIRNRKDAEIWLDSISNTSFRIQTGKKTSQYIFRYQGSTEKILHRIQQIKSPG